MREGSTAFLFAAQGTQWPGMGRDLMAEDATFRGVISRCDESIRRHFDWSLCTELACDPNSCRLHNDPSMVQPALTSLQIALTETLTGRGVVPDAVGSLSMGEAAGAYAAGMLDLDDAIDVACSTARLAETKLRCGLMAFLRATLPECTALIANVANRVVVAVELGQQLTIISGEETTVREVLSRAPSLGIACGPLPLAQAYHSPDVASLGRGFMERLSGLRSRRGLIDSYSSVTGSIQADVTVEHCWHICSQPARFYTLALAMIRDGCSRFIEIGPHPMLTQTIHEAAARLEKTVEVHAVMQRGVSASECLANAGRSLPRSTLAGDSHCRVKHPPPGSTSIFSPQR
jgi:acyl transferase domain-containing protein